MSGLEEELESTKNEYLTAARVQMETTEALAAALDDKTLDPWEIERRRVRAQQAASEARDAFRRWHATILRAHIWVGRDAS